MISSQGKKNKKTTAINMDHFKKDIDGLIGEFAQDELTTLDDMKRVWLSKKFSYIYAAAPVTDLAFFMQSLYAHCIGYMAGNASLSHRLAGLYCLYILYEIQPYKPKFLVYLSVGELAKLKILVVDAKANDIKRLPALVKKMLEQKMFLFGAVELMESYVTETGNQLGAVDLMESPVTETVDQLQQIQSARLQVAYEKLFSSTPLEKYTHMDLGMEVDLDKLKEMSSEYDKAKGVAIKEASNIVDVQDINHIAEDKESIVDTVEKIADDWRVQKQTFYKQTGMREDDGYDRELEQLLLGHNPDDGEESDEE